MASQRYGAGLSAVISIQNFWRWRLAKDSEPSQFDRFWRQLFRFLSESSRQDVMIHLADQNLQPQTDIHLLLEKQPNPKNLTNVNQKFVVRVEDEQKKPILEQTLELAPGRAVDASFRAEKAGLYNVTVQDMAKQPVATRTIEVRDINVEFQNTARDMETLRQWAALSDGLALKAEECDDTGAVIEQIKSKVEQIRRGKAMRQPVGVNGWMMASVLGCLGAEWVLRKKWGLAENEIDGNRAGSRTPRPDYDRVARPGAPRSTRHIFPRPAEIHHAKIRDDLVLGHRPDLVSTDRHIPLL